MSNGMHLSLVVENGALKWVGNGTSGNVRNALKEISGALDNQKFVAQLKNKTAAAITHLESSNLTIKQGPQRIQQLKDILEKL